MERVLCACGEGLARYRARDWVVATSSFEGALTAFPGDLPSKFYIHRARDSQLHPATQGLGWRLGPDAEVAGTARRLT